MSPTHAILTVTPPSMAPVFRPLSRRAVLGAGLLLGAALSGCDAQVGSEYGGEPLAEMRGTIVVAEGTSLPTQAQASVVWHVWSEGDSASLTNAVPVEGSFPASFTMSLLTPPPAPTLFDLGEEHESLAGIGFASGYVMVLPEGLPPSGMEQMYEGALGTDNDHLLIYADGPVPPNVLVQFPGGLHEGYQLFRVVRPDKTEANACVAAANACQDACFATPCNDDAACTDAAFACYTACPSTETCPYYDHDGLAPVALSDAMTIVIGGEKLGVDWF